MKMDIIHGSITDIESDALIVNLFEGVTIPGGATGAVDMALGGAISSAIAAKETTGKLMETTLIHTYGKIAPKRVLVIGLGKSEDFDLSTVEKVSGAAVRFLRGKGVKTVTSILHGAGIGSLDASDSARAVVEGTIIGLYRSSLYKNQKETPNEIESFSIVERNETKIKDVDAGVKLGRILAEATNLARTMVNEPASKMTPTILAQRAQDVANEYGLGIEILERDRMAELNMGGVLGVAQGSVEPPKFIIMRYRVSEDRPTLALVGKGITFDSGGLSIKSEQGMEDMKDDMGGGAAVIQTMRAISQLKPNINITAIIPATENMPSGSSFKPGDVLTFMNGKTAEITSTDAEGRLILADGLAYAAKDGADFIVNIATLTGGVVVALGHDYTGIFGNNRKLLEDIKEVASSTNERVWELPLPKDYMDILKSSIADFTNDAGRWASAIQGGLFLQEFVNDVPWVHVDIGGTANITHGHGPSNYENFKDPGGTGVGVRTLTMLAMKLAG